jgi:hypothetical protein
MDTWPFVPLAATSSFGNGLGPTVSGDLIPSKEDPASLATNLGFRSLNLTGPTTTS